MAVIGSINEIKRYPVKSMRGESLKEVFVNYSGLTGDRVYAFVNPEKQDNFPWHTAREQHDLLLYQPYFRRSIPKDKQYPEATEFAVSVTDPHGNTFPLTDETFLTSLQTHAGAKFVLRFSEKGQHDARPISLISHASILALEKEAGISLDPARFRANFYVSWQNADAFYEDSLVDRHLKIGAKLEVRIVKKDPRCKIINLDPATATHHPEVLQNVAKNHRGCIGVYAAVIREGEVKAGDDIVLV